MGHRRKEPTSEEENGGWGNSWNSNGPQGDGEGDWACFECDPYERGVKDTYQGNYASDKWCRGCGKHKGKSHHKLMTERFEIIKNGTYKSRAEAKAERLKG